jgi:hypothetical protein
LHCHQGSFSPFPQLFFQPWSVWVELELLHHDSALPVGFRIYKGVEFGIQGWFYCLGHLPRLWRASDAREALGLGYFRQPALKGFLDVVMKRLVLLDVVAPLGLQARGCFVRS